MISHTSEWPLFMSVRMAGYLSFVFHFCLPLCWFVCFIHIWQWQRHHPCYYYYYYYYLLAASQSMPHNMRECMHAQARMPIRARIFSVFIPNWIVCTMHFLMSCGGSNSSSSHWQRSQHRHRFDCFGEKGEIFNRKQTEKWKTTAAIMCVVRTRNCQRCERAFSLWPQD